jgi:hypothetical protein
MMIPESVVILMRMGPVLNNELTGFLGLAAGKDFFACGAVLV